MKVELSDQCKKGNHDKCCGKKLPKRKVEDENLLCGGYMCICSCHTKIIKLLKQPYFPKKPKE